MSNTRKISMGELSGEIFISENGNWNKDLRAYFANKSWYGVGEEDTGNRSLQTDN
jgi:hypothetical protein